jgi:ADP-ribose pyrophosphatase
MSDKPTPIEAEQYQYKGKIVAVVTQRMKVGDKEILFERARRSPGTRLIVFSKKGKVMLTEEHRTELGEVDYRLPGGKVFDTLDEYLTFVESKGDMLEAAKKAAILEAKQETGLIVTELEHFYTSKAGATVDWDLFYFVIKEYEEAEGGQELDGLGEDIKVGWYKREEAIEIALSGKMKEDRSVGVLLRFLNEN